MSCKLLQQIAPDRILLIYITPRTPIQTKTCLEKVNHPKVFGFTARYLYRMSSVIVNYSLTSALSFLMHSVSQTVANRSSLSKRRNQILVNKPRQDSFVVVINALKLTFCRTHFLFKGWRLSFILSRENNQYLLMELRKNVFRITCHVIYPLAIKVNFVINETSNCAQVELCWKYGKVTFSKWTLCSAKLIHVETLFPVQILSTWAS